VSSGPLYDNLSFIITEGRENINTEPQNHVSLEIQMFLLLALHNTLDSFDLHVYNSLYNTVIQTSVFSYGPKITTHTITYQKFQQGGGEGGMVNGLKYQNFDKKVQYRGGWEVNPMNLQWGDGIDTLSVYI